MNAVGLLDDVNTLLHEAGHAFHAFAAHRQPLLWQRHPGAESAELASMSMELLAAPYLAAAGRHGVGGGAAGWRGSSTSRTCSSRWRTWPRWTPSSTGSTPAGRAPTRPRATRPGSGSGTASRRGWTGSGLERRADRALVPPAAHLPLPVLLHRVRHRPARRAAGLAATAGATRRPRSRGYREALALGGTVPAARACTRRGGCAARRFDAGADRRAGGAGRGGDSTAPARAGVGPGCVRVAPGRGQDSPPVLERPGRSAPSAHP